jgi:uncharacterized protein (TIGR03437 family)
LNGSGQASITQSPAVGSHNILATYNATSNFVSSNNSSQTLSVTMASTTTSVALTSSAIVYGQANTITATVSANAPSTATPGGSVTFYDNTTSTTLASNVSLNGSGQASISPSLAVGSHNILATYNATSSFVTSNNSSQTLTVTAASTSTSISPVSTVTYGQSQTFTATVTANSPSTATPTGTVTFVDTTTSTTLASNVSLNGSGQASSGAIVLGAGSHSVKATYNPSPANFTTSNNSITAGVNPATLTVTANNASRAYGTANPTFTATITGFVNGDPSSVVSGTPSLTTTATTSSPMGGYTITAAQGSLAAANYTFSFVNGTLTVNGALLTVTASGSTRAYGQPNSLSYSITGFVNGDTIAVVSGAPLLSSAASITSPPGTYQVTASQGTLAATNYLFTFVPSTMTVVQAATQLGVNGVSPGTTASPGQSFVVSFIVASAPGAAAPTGTVSYSVDGGAVQTVALSNGMATVTIAGLSAGAHVVSNSYSGDSNYLPTTATPLTLTIMKASSQLSVVVMSTIYSTPQFTLDFTVTGSGATAPPTGTVTCAFPSLATQSATLTGGTGALPISGLTAGTYSVTCSYSGDANYPAAVAPSVTLTVTPQLNTGGVVGAAGVNAGVSPGWLISLYGINLQGSTSPTGGSVTATSLPLTTTLGGTQVLINGTPAPLLFVSPMQINAQAPFETPVGTPVQVVVIGSTLSSLPVMVTFNTYAPSVFLYPRTATSTDPVITHANNTLVTPSSPAQAGEILTIWATGGGPLNNQPMDGAPGPTSSPSTTVVRPTVTIGGLPGTVLFSGLAPTFVGEWQINVQLPATLPAGIGTPPTLPVVVMFPGANSTPVNLWMNQ